MDESVVVFGDGVQVDFVDERAGRVKEIVVHALQQRISFNCLIKVDEGWATGSIVVDDSNLLLFDPEEDEGWYTQHDWSNIGHDDGPSASLLPRFISGKGKEKQIFRCIGIFRRKPNSIANHFNVVDWNFHGTKRLLLNPWRELRYWPIFRFKK